MKPYLYILLLLICACNKKSNGVKSNETIVSKDTVKLVMPTIAEKEATKEYSNQRFRKVIIEKISENAFRIKGEAQIFEANFSWIIEDGHNELKKGNQMTDAGAPEWGKFDFDIDVEKKKENSTLHLILFEVSAKDGSRQYELPVPLP
jgi:hypothetical protein